MTESPPKAPPRRTSHKVAPVRSEREGHLNFSSDIDVNNQQDEERGNGNDRRQRRIDQARRSFGGSPSPPHRPQTSPVRETRFWLSLSKSLSWFAPCT